MLSKPVRTILTIIAPVGFLAAAELPPMQPTPAMPPQAQAHNVRLINAVVPHYGTVNYRSARRDSRVEQLYHRIRTFSAGLDSKVLSGEVHRPAVTYQLAEDERGYPVAQTSERQPLPQEEALVGLLEELAVLQTEVPYPNHYEEWHFDEAWGDLQRSAQALRLGLSEDAYLHLEQLHAAWLTHYHQSLAKAQAEFALELIEQGQAPDSALAQAKDTVKAIPYPKMSLDGQYPALLIPPVVPRSSQPQPTTKPAPKPAPAAPSTQTGPAATPDTAPAPAKRTAPTPQDQPKPAAPMAPGADLVDADRIFEAGSSIYQQAVSNQDFDQRDQLYNTAEYVLAEAARLYGESAEAEPGNEALAEKLRQANQLRYGAVKQARSNAEKNRAAKRDAAKIIEAALAGESIPADLAPAVETEEVVLDQPVIEEPVDIEPEPEEPIAEPMVEAEPEPAAPAEAEEPMDEEKVDEAVEALDDLDWPDL